MEMQQIKQRFGIIGNSEKLNRAIDIACQVAPTDLSVLISGESGTGKEMFPQIIHQLSVRKHGAYIAVNCGAIPEGTIDSELFGHEKGAFTGALEHRKGYFEVADKGTIFLDEVAELPLSTQVRLLRVLESGEFIKVGSSKVLKTDVRVVAATNINIVEAIGENKFREDLYYRLNTVPISVPPLRDRKYDIILLFKKFAQDFGERYRMPALKLTPEAEELILNYRWPGNIRQLKNITEQMSVIEEDRTITPEKLHNYLPIYDGNKLPAIYENASDKSFASEREILYKILFDLRNDITDLKKLVREIMHRGVKNTVVDENNAHLIEKLNEPIEKYDPPGKETSITYSNDNDNLDIEDTQEIIEESLSLEEKEKELIRKALEKHDGKRKAAADELGISERTLYRKIKEYDIK